MHGTAMTARLTYITIFVGSQIGDAVLNAVNSGEQNAQALAIEYTYVLAKYGTQCDACLYVGG